MSDQTNLHCATQGEGNTIPLQKDLKRSRGWCFTRNNPTIDWMDTVTQHLPPDTEYIAQEERGEKGTPHIQGALYFKDAKTFKAVLKFVEGAHIEAMKGRKIDCKKYCWKDETREPGGKRWRYGFYSGHENMRVEMENRWESKIPHQWQLDCLEMLEHDPDERSIHWYFDKNGGAGKTLFAKHLALKGDCLVVNGKQADVLYGLANWVKNDKRKQGPRIVIWIAPREHTEYINYGALEVVKDGLFYSTKYESGMVIYNNPHLLVFCNLLPEKDKLTEGRVILHEIGVTPPKSADPGPTAPAPVLAIAAGPRYAAVWGRPPNPLTGDSVSDSRGQPQTPIVGASSLRSGCPPPATANLEDLLGYRPMDLEPLGDIDQFIELEQPTLRRNK